jgi:hypothetical protein
LRPGGDHSGQVGDRSAREQYPSRTLREPEERDHPVDNALLKCDGARTCVATAGVLIRSSSKKRAERRCVETPRRDAGEEARRGGVESGVNCLIQHVQQSFNADSLPRWGGKQTRYQLGIWSCRRGRRRSTAFLEVIQIGKHCFTDKLSLLTIGFHRQARCRLERGHRDTLCQRLTLPACIC